MQALQRADLAVVQPSLQRLVLGIETPVEGHVERRLGRGEPGRGGLQAGQAEIQRLLAEHRLAGLQARQGVAQMGAGRTGDNHRIDAGVAEDGVQIDHPRPDLPGQHLRRVAARVRDQGQVQARIGAGVARMDGPHPAGSQLGDLEHQQSLPVAHLQFAMPRSGRRRLMTQSNRVAVRVRLAAANAQTISDRRTKLYGAAVKPLGRMKTLLER